MTKVGQTLVEEIIRNKNWDELRHALVKLDPADIAEFLLDLPEEDDVVVFRLLPRELAAQTFTHLPLDHQERLLHAVVGEPLRHLLNDLPPDDRNQLLGELPAEMTRRLLEVLSPEELRAARELLGYPEDAAGRHMTPEYLALRPEMTVGEALEHIRRQARGAETLNVLYVVDERGYLVREVRLGTLVTADPGRRVGDIEDRPLVSVPAAMDREEVLRVFEKYDRVVLPVVDLQGQMLGIITVDDMLDVSKEEATEDIHKIGGMQALEVPYLQASVWSTVAKRAGWLSALFVGGMLTASAMGYYEGEIARAVVLALFVPLIISSGGNSGSQAATLLVRSLALREVELGDWLRVFRRELLSGLTLGAWLGLIVFARVALWQELGLADYGPHYLWMASAIAGSLVGVVTFGSLVGSMLPFLLQRLGLDPASSSAPLVATLADVTGIVIYFTVASLLLSGRLL